MCTASTIFPSLQNNNPGTLSLCTAITRWLCWRNLRISLVPWQVHKMSEPPICIIHPLAGHVYFHYLFDAIDLPQPLQLQEHSKGLSKGWHSGLSLWAWSNTRTNTCSAQSFWKGSNGFKISGKLTVWHHPYFPGSHLPQGKKKFSVGICILLPMFQPHSSSICRTSGSPSHVFNISPFLSVGWKKPLFSTIKSKAGYTHVSAVYRPLFPPLGQLTRDNDLYPWSICFI